MRGAAAPRDQDRLRCDAQAFELRRRSRLVCLESPVVATVFQIGDQLSEVADELRRILLAASAGLDYGRAVEMWLVFERHGSAGEPQHDQRSRHQAENRYLFLSHGDGP